MSSIDAEALYRALVEQIRSVYGQTLASNDGPVLAGIYSGGVWLAEWLAKNLNAPSFGVVNVALHRDDYAKKGLHSQARPTQGLLDMCTIRHYKRDFTKLRVAIVGDILHSRVARSDIHALTTLGVPEVRAIGPRTLLPEQSRSNGRARLSQPRRRSEGRRRDHLLRLQNERMSGALLPSAQEYFKSWGLAPEQLALAAPDAIVMHPGPMNHGVEIDSQVADGPHR